MRDTRELRVRPRFDWMASPFTLSLIHSFFASYMWPIDAANDRDQWAW